MDSEPVNRIPPNLLFQSFLVVGGGYLSSFAFFLAAMWALPQIFFPEVAAIWADPEHLKNVIENSPEDFFTQPYFWSLFVVSTLAHLVIGPVIVRLAPFAKTPHLVLTALVILVTFLQLSMSQPASVKWMFLLLMIACPSALWISGYWMIGRLR